MNSTGPSSTSKTSRMPRSIIPSRPKRKKRNRRRAQSHHAKAIKNTIHTLSLDINAAKIDSPGDRGNDRKGNNDQSRSSRHHKTGSYHHSTSFTPSPTPPELKGHSTFTKSSLGLPPPGANPKFRRGKSTGSMGLSAVKMRRQCSASSDLTRTILPAIHDTTASGDESDPSDKSDVDLYPFPTTLTPTHPKHPRHSMSSSSSTIKLKINASNSNSRRGRPMGNPSRTDSTGRLNRRQRNRSSINFGSNGNGNGNGNPLRPPPSPRTVARLFVEHEKNTLIEQMRQMQSSMVQLGDMLRKSDKDLMVERKDLMLEREQTKKLTEQVNNLADENMTLRSEIAKQRADRNTVWQDLEFYKLAVRTREKRAVVLQNQINTITLQKRELSEYSQRLLEQLTDEKAKTQRLTLRIRKYSKNVRSLHKRTSSLSGLTRYQTAPFQKDGDHSNTKRPQTARLDPKDEDRKESRESRGSILGKGN